MDEFATAEKTDKPQRGRSVGGARALDSLDFGARTSGAAAQSRFRRAQRLRLVLPVLAGLLIIIFMVQSGGSKPGQASLDDFASLTAATDDLRMANPRFVGVDDDGKPFEITATEGMQSKSGENVVSLTKPQASQGEDDATSTVTAEKGVYRSEENILLLEEDVRFSHQIGEESYLMRSPAATVAITDQIVSSVDGVDATGPDGSELKADKMTAYRSDGRVVFEGNVSMRVYPKSTPLAKETKAPTLRDGAENLGAGEESNEEGDA